MKNGFAPQPAVNGFAEQRLRAFVDDVVAPAERQRQAADRAALIEWAGSTWPAVAAKAALSGAMLPGDVAQGKFSMDDPRAIERLTDLTGLITLGAGALPAQKNALRMGVKLHGGGMSDPTQTGWTFRDVKKPNMTRSQNKRYSEASKVPRTETVPINRLYATQNTVNPDFATTETSAGMLPKVVRVNGELYVMDGHHRLTKIAEDGGQNAKVELFDFDMEDAPEMPLLDFDPKKKAKFDKEIDAILNELFDDEELTRLGIL